ncbi:hypothetical protein ADM99_09575 [Leptolinea tardivitalis]|uniref:Lipoprotein signal peptidase n=1 Tax=Leptolinea tardivitalis TaxID=229920 RepID=A0A0P6WYQ2_9CHLR|nr:hypothetical protein ADM99_09575 [Leptolinea tardivitalis]
MGDLSLTKTIKNYLFLFIVSGVLTALDQWSKYAIRTNLSLGEIWSPWDWMTPYARFVHWQNTGVAFGMFQGNGNIFAVLSAAVSVIIIYYYPRVIGDSKLLRLVTSILLAGSLGNFFDRVTVGYVTDFISIGNFPVFNIADSCISVGVVILLIYVWFEERKDKKKQQADAVLEPVDDKEDRED